ncbi:MAG: CBS domain-containing protein [Anaerolineales bacterium]
MQVKDVMTSNPTCCTPETNLQKVAQMMVENDCGCIPVVENKATMKPVGVVTDRDICCRTVAEGQNPLDMTAEEVMSSPVVIVTPEDSIEDCCQVMEEHQIRRVPVVDADGGCCGMVAQADVALKTSKQTTAEVVKQVSQPTGTAVSASA